MLWEGGTTPGFDVVRYLACNVLQVVHFADDQMDVCTVPGVIVQYSSFLFSCRLSCKLYIHVKYNVHMFSQFE